MSHTTNPLISCPEIQDQLDAHFTQCDPTMMTQDFELNFLQFLQNPINTTGMLQRKISPGRGKKRIVELTYTPRVLPAEISSTPARVCTSDNVAGMLSQTYTLGNTGAQLDECFDINDLADICKDNPVWIGERLRAMMDGILRKMDIDLINDVPAFVGAFGEGEENVVADVKTVTTLISAGVPDPEFHQDISFAGMNAGYCTIPYAFGYNEAWRAAKRVAAGCCADSGLDIERNAVVWPFVMMGDSNVENTFSANHFFTMAAGALQLITWNEFEGERGINVVDTEHYKQTVLVDPRTGIKFDFQWNNDCGKITINLKLIYQLEGLPSDLFDVGDRYDGVTQVNEYVISNP